MNIIRLHKIENDFFESNTFVLWRKGLEDCYVIDCGDIEPLSNFIEANKLKLKAVMLTHGHFDHIYGLNGLYERFPEAKIFVSENAQLQLSDDKLNYSRFHEQPFVYQGDKSNLILLQDGDRIHLWDDKPDMEVMATPGHDKGCMTFIESDYIFTGDSYIPGIKTVTNLRGNKQQAAESETKIKALVAERGLIICPGHGDIANGLLTSL